MANLANLNVSIGTNLGGLRSGLANAQGQVGAFAKGVDKHLSGLSADRLTKSLMNIDDTIPSANKLVGSLGKIESGLHGASSASRGFSGVSTGLNRSFQQGTSQIRQSSVAVVNFNRVIQDAPFGIIGVANNIEPLISSFSSLRTQIGSTSGALLHLGKSLVTGPGALITAASVIPSLLLVWKMRTREVGQASKDAAEDVNSLAEAGKNLNAILSGDSGFIRRLDQEIDRTEAALALAEEREDAEFRIAAAQATAGRGQRLQDTEEIRSLRERISAIDEIIEVMDIEKSSIKELEDTLKDLRKQQEVYNGVLGTSEQQAAAYAQTLTEDASEALLRFNTGVDTNTDSLVTNRDRIKGLIGSWQILARQGQSELIPIIALLQESLEDLNDALPEGGVTEKPELPSIGLPDPEDITQSIDDVLKDIDLGKVPKITADLLFPAGSLGDLEHRLSLLKEQLRAATDPEVIQGLIGGIGELQGRINAFGEQGEETFEGLIGFANGFGNALSQAVLHGKDLEQVLANLAKQLAAKAFVVGLGALLTGGASLGKKSFLANVFGGFRAHGGPVSAGTSYVVGERGPELFTPSASGQITPNGGGQNIVMAFEKALSRVQFVQRGTDIVGVYNMASSQYRR